MITIRSTAHADNADDVPTQPARGTETILVADDDDGVRLVLVRALRQLGYRVLEAATGREAIRLAAAYGKPIDLVLADVVMPSMTTDDLRAQLADTQPDARLAFMSGYIHDSVVRRNILRGPVPFLEKPFTVRQLAGAVRQFLEFEPTSPMSPVQATGR